MSTNKQNKYFKSSEVKIVEPKKEFYKLYNSKQRLDIMRNIELYREIPRQYNYFGKGAEHWDSYVQRLSNEDTMNTLTSTIDLLKDNKEHINYLTRNYSFINVVDIGIGNAYPAKVLLRHLFNEGKLGRYIGLDISKSMLELAERNIMKWFGSDILFSGYVYDINRHSFMDVLAEKNKIANDLNLILLLGGTLSNMRSPDIAYKMIHESMTDSDILIHVTKLDNEVSRKYFDFNAPSNTALSASHKLMLELLSIDESIYDVEMGYDHSIKERYIRVRLRTAVKIEFKSKNKIQDVLLRKDDTILVWRAIQHTRDSILSQFDRNNFNVVHVNETSDQSHILTMSYIR